jgi:serine/threonine protein kinase
MALYPGKLGEESHTGDNRIMPMLNRLRLARAKFRRNKLQKKIHSAMEESRSYDASCPAQRFFPKDKLCQVINTTTVFDELVKCLPNTIAKNQIQEYADRICDVTVSFEGGKERRKSYRLIFVILVLVERSKHILSFLHADVSDLDLPLEPVKERGIVSGMRRHRSISEGTPHEFLECFKDEGWSPSSMEQFDRYQWFMLAPFFSHGEYGQIKHYIFHDQHILPFITQNEVGVDETEILGGFGRVIMVTMHHAHHDFNSETNLSCNFAVKQVFENDRQSFQREREIWKKFSGGNSHRHIVSLLATYSHRNKYHFIFDRAQGDLMQFWERYEESPILTHSDVVWVADQCYGITEGLSRIHKHKMFKSDISTPDRYDVKYGRHGDINPQNILWFRDDTGESDAMEGTMRGTLKITDFGTAEMRSFWTSPREQDDYNGFTYRAPESDSTDGAIQQARDIWALGCVLLDFVTWTLGGASLVQRFAKERLSRDPAYGNIKTDTFFELVFKGDDLGMEAKIKDSIFEVKLLTSMPYVLVTDYDLKFVKALHNHPRCTEFLHNLLNIVICDMLLLKSEERLNCWQICTKLRRLRDDCQSDEYAMGYSPWRNIDQLSPEQVLRPSARGLSRQTDIIANWLLPPLESWEFHVDNDFAGKALENISMRTSLEIEATRNILCKRCAKLNFWSSRFAIVDQLQALAKSALNCDLCKLLHDASYGNDSSSNGQLRFERIDSVIMMTGHTFPLLSLMRNPGESVTHTFSSIADQ